MTFYPTCPACAAATIDGHICAVPFAPDPAYVEQEGTAQAPYRPLVAEGNGARPIDPRDASDLVLWGSTLEYLLETGQQTEDALDDLDRRALAAYRAARDPGEPPVPAWATDFGGGLTEWPKTDPGEPLAAVDPDDDRYGHLIYEAFRAGMGDTIPEWQYLGDHARASYRRQGRFVREHLGPTEGVAEPVRTVLGFGSPTMAAEVLDTLRQWRADDRVDDVEIEALIERIEKGDG